MRYTDPEVRPPALPVVEENIPDALKPHRAWVIWRWEWSNERGQWSKAPRHPDGHLASTTNPSSWSNLQEVHAAYLSGGWDGIGFVLHKAIAIVGIDLDDCRNSESGEIQPWALEIARELQSYGEISPSGRGVRLFCRGSLEGSGRKRGPIEVYSETRYLTVTGQRLSKATEPQPAAQAIERLYASLRPETKELFHPAQPVGPSLEDEEVIRRAMGASNGPQFRQLWEGVIDGYPSHSEADQALCDHLAFWTGRDPAAVDRLFRRSGLMREKWDSRRGESSYGAQTVNRAVEDTRQAYSGEEASTTVDRAKLRRPPAPQAAVNGHAPAQINRQLIIRHISELHRMPAAEAEWIVERFCARGAITELSAWIKTGKSTLMAQMIASIVRGQKFLGHEVRQSPVLLLSEEGPATLSSAVDEVGVKDGDPLHVCMWFENQRSGWSAAITEAIERCQEDAIPVLVVDTLSRWAGVSDENDAALADRVMAPLQELAKSLAVIVVRQAGKSDREAQHAGRGSSVYSGSADILLHLQHWRNERGGLMEEDPRRSLSIVSRFEREVIPRLSLIYREGRYESLESGVTENLSLIGKVLADLLENGPARAATIAERCRERPSSVRTALVRLVRRDQLSVSEGIYTVIDPEAAEAAIEASSRSASEAVDEAVIDPNPLHDPASPPASDWQEPLQGF